MRQRDLDILSFIDWVKSLEKSRHWFTQGGCTWIDENRNASIMKPGEVESSSEIDQYLPEYIGLLNIEIYWPSLSP